MLTKAYKPYQIVVVPFPFTDTAHTKRRPALVISSEKYQKTTGHVTLMMITSAKNSDWDGDHPIQDLKVTGLPVESFVRLKIFTIDLRLVVKSIGQLGVTDKKEIQGILKRYFAF